MNIALFTIMFALGVHAALTIRGAKSGDEALEVMSVIAGVVAVIVAVGALFTYVWSPRAATSVSLGFMAAHALVHFSMPRASGTSRDR